jgi:hypothetical protein
MLGTLRLISITYTSTTRSDWYAKPASIPHTISPIMPAIPIDTRALSQELGKQINYYAARSTQELGEHLNYFVARSIDHRALETIAVRKYPRA